MAVLSADVLRWHVSFYEILFLCFARKKRGIIIFVSTPGVSLQHFQNQTVAQTCLN